MLDRFEKRRCLAPFRTLSAGGGISEIDHVGCVAFSAHLLGSRPRRLETFWRRCRHSARIVHNSRDFEAFGCGGVQPAVLAAVERGGVTRFTHYRERIRRLKADGDTGFPLKSNSPDSRASIASTRPAAFRRFQLSSIIPCSELTERLFEV